MQIFVDYDVPALKATIEQLNHQVRSQQAEMDRLHKTIEAYRKHHYEDLAQLKNTYAKERANLNDAIEKANTQLTESRAASAEYKGQLQLLKTQNTDLIAKLGDGPRKTK